MMLNAETATSSSSNGVAEECAEEENPSHSSALSPTDPVSLARLHLFNAAYRWSVQPENSQPEEYRVKWEGHMHHLSQQVAQLENDSASADVTVATKGINIPSHRIVLAAASSFFRGVLQEVPVSQHPVIVVRDTDPRHLRYVVSFCYSGSVRIPQQDVDQVLKLAQDLEISGLKIVRQEEESSDPPPPTTTLRNRFFRPPSPTRFTFTPPMHVHSPPTLQERCGSSPGPKRANTPLDLQDTQSKKRCKVEPLSTSRGENDSPSSLVSPRSTPPGSAPPHLVSHAPSTPFFRSHRLTPPHSAPPQSVRELSSSHDADRLSSLSVVPSSRLIQPRHQPLHPLPAHSSPSSTPSSPKQGVPSPTPLGGPSTSPAHLTLPNAPASSFSQNESQIPSTPTTPTTPYTPTVQNEASNRGIGSSGSSGSRVLLWRFLLDLLHNPKYTPIYIRWLDRPAGIFRIMESDMVAQLWGSARKNNNMNYEKMSRGMRTYYKRGILFHIDGTKLIYKFNTKDPEIQQRMRYYDLTLKSLGEEDSCEQVAPSFLTSHGLFSLPRIPSFPSLPVTTAASMESLYSPLLRDTSQLTQSFLYDPYLSFLRASKQELC
ncbi:ETS translocation variant 5-like [Homarus americanus]|uniref:ETS translocation variant 5-like n=1 Tax=Homarus americanus TaxID=6706 RepID=UPI001C45CF7C|nr:ETS translocation variant 5-like [Homarus americanus]